MVKPKRTQLIFRGEAFSGMDKRVFGRFDVPEIAVRYKDLKIGDRGFGSCCNFSGSGACIESYHELKQKTPLEMWFEVAVGSDPIHLLGRVVWVNRKNDRWKMGVSFERQKLMNVSRMLRLVPIQQES